MEKDRLDKIFERSWPDLESDITAALERVPSPKPERKMQDMMAEVVETVRPMDRRLDEDLVLAENGKPIIARMARCIDGNAGRRLLAEQRQLRTWLAERRVGLPTAEDRVTAALAEARNRGIAADQDSYL